MEQVDQRNIAYLRDSSEGELVDWLLNLNEANSIEPFRFNNDDSFSSHIQRLARVTRPEEIGIKMRRVVTSALKKWRPETYSGEISGLAFMASDLGAVEALPRLAEFVDQDVQLNPHPRTDRFIKGNVVAVMARFSPHPNAVEPMERWFREPKYERYKALLMNGLAVAHPGRYLEYLSEYYDSLRRNPDAFENRGVIYMLAGRIGMRYFVESLHQLDQPDLDLSIKALIDMPGTAIVVDREVMSVKESKSGVTHFFTPQTFEDVDKLRTAFFRALSD